MPSETEATSPEPDGLQFDHAEFDDHEESVAVACASCKQEIDDHYYEINGTIFCESCRALIEAHLQSGSGLVRFLKAIVLGSGAAVISASIYFAVYHYLHFEASLVSILCGFIIGKAVRQGSGGRGGLNYQILAVLLTYLAIGMAYTGIGVARGMLNRLVNQPGLAGMNEFAILKAKVIIVVYSTVVSPFYMAKDNLISLVIIGFALWEAWKFTKAAKLIVTGPYRVGDPEPETGFEGVAGHA